MRPYPVFAILGLVALVSAPGHASPPRAGPPKVDRVQLAVVDSGGASCPRDAVLTAWAHTSGPGTVRFVIHNDGGGKTGELKANAVAGAAGTYLATYKHTFKITTDIDVAYMAEAAGSEQPSNWVPFEATCGPRARATTSATGSSGGPPARGPESRARQSLGDPVAGGGEPPARTAAQSADPRENAGGTSKPNSSGGNDAKCGTAVTSTRYGALTKAGGKMTAKVGWIAAVAQKHPDSWAYWDNATERSLGCKRAGLLWTCKASARPCDS